MDFWITQMPLWPVEYQSTAVNMDEVAGIDDMARDGTHIYCFTVEIFRPWKVLKMTDRKVRKILKNCDDGGVCVCACAFTLIHL